MVKPKLKNVALAAGLGLAYACAGKLGLSLAFLNDSVSPVWPPTGLALAALLLLGHRFWPAIFVGAFAVNFWTKPHLASALAIAAGNTLEAVVGALLARRLARGVDSFEQAPDIFRFIFLAALPGTAISAATGIVTLRLSGQVTADDALGVWLTWWTGNLVSALVIAPLLVVWLREPLPRTSFAQRVEIGLLTLALLGTCAITFGSWDLFGSRNYPLAFVCLPPLTWAAFRFCQRGATASAALMTALGACATIAGYGAFVVPNPNDSLLLLQAFIGFNALTMLALAAVVSERQRVAASLGRNVLRLQLALDAATMGAWEWDIPTGKVRWSEGLELIHGLAPGSFAGTFEAFMADVHPDDRRHVQQSLAQVMRDRSDHLIEYRVLGAGGAIRWVEGRGRLVLDNYGNPLRLVGVCMDITQRKQAQFEREQLLQREKLARAEAERANRSKDDFLAVVSHELRTPLTPVLLTASILERDSHLPARVRDDIETIRRNVEMEARLIDDLLDLTRISRGKLKLEPQVSDLHEIVHRAIEICCRDARLRLVVQLEAARHHIRADAGRIQQIMWNLLNNARKFTPAGGTVTISSANPDEQTIVVQVSDTGMGIAPEKLARLFDAFEQGDSAEARRAGGLGLGLAISRALAEAHGGALTAASAGVGRGATFKLRFATVSADPAPRADGNGRDLPNHSAQSFRVLVVEDDHATLRAIQRLLSLGHHHVVVATSVSTALEAASREPIDLVISDLGLPDGLGYDLMRQLMQQYGVRGIALSGYGMSADVEKSRQAGFIEHLTKPIDAATLDAVIGRVMGNGAKTH
jgi:PAS domain S-box-containing protein